MSRKGEYPLRENTLKKKRKVPDQEVTKIKRNSW